MAFATRPRLENLLAALSLNLADEAAAALERASGLTGSATAGLLALEEFLGESTSAGWPTRSGSRTRARSGWSASWRRRGSPSAGPEPTAAASRCA